MESRKILTITIVIVSVFWVAACIAPTEPPRPSSSLPSPTAVQPVPAGVSSSPLPVPNTALSPLSPTGVATTVLAPKDAGAATGQLLRIDGSAMKEVLVYAAPIDKSQNFAVASVDAATDAHVFTDGAGNFAFASLKPGEYVLVARTPTNLVLLQSSDDKVTRFEAKANQVTALGTKKVKFEYPNGD